MVPLPQARVRFLSFAFALALSITASASGADTESRIVSITVNPTSLVSGGPVSVSVATTSDIVSVEAVVGPHRVTIPEIGSGEYYGSATVPHLPRFIRGLFRVRFFGKTAAGETVVADTTVQLN